MADNTSLNVKFLRGTQSNLDKLQNFQAGAFYLTSDTDRLYYAQANDELVYLNRYIVSVNSINDLPAINTANVGDFYYITNGNILCTKQTENATQYSQINPDTIIEIDKNNSELKATVAQDDQGNNQGIQLDLKIQQAQKYTAGDGTLTPYGDEIQFTTMITKEMLGSVTTNVALDVNASQTEDNTDKIVNIDLSGVGIAADATGFDIVAGDNIKVGIDDNGGVKIDAAGVELSKAEGSNILALTHGFNNDKDEIVFADIENGDVEVDISEQNKFVIKHKTYDTPVEKPEEKATPVPGESFTAVTGITASNGHITEVKTTELVLPTYDIGLIQATENGGLEIKLKDNNNTQTDGVIANNLIYYSIGSDTVYNQSDLADYLVTKAELRNYDAMAFKGSVGSAEGATVTALPTEGVRVGDTYKVVGDNSVEGSNGVVGHKGDLFIATGKEDTTTGVITENLVWVLIPAGDDTDTSYTFKVNAVTKTIDINDQSVNNNLTASIGFSSGNDAISVAANAPEAGSQGGSFVISHSTIDEDNLNKSTESNVAYSAGFNAITGISVNEYGHVEEVTTTTFTMPEQANYVLDCQNQINTVQLKAVHSNNDVVGEIKILGSENDKITVDCVEESLGENSIGERSAFTVKHATMTVAEDTSAESDLNGKDAITVVTGIDDDGYGHLSKITTTKYILPDYSLGTLAAVDSENNNIVTVTTQLKDKNGSVIEDNSTAFKFTSETLKVSVDGTDTVKAELVWGSF